MTNEVDILRKALLELEKSIKLKNLNQELYDQLSGSIHYLIRYSEKYHVPLPKKNELIQMLDKADLLIDGIISTSKQQTPKLNTKKFTDETPDSEQKWKSTPKKPRSTDFLQGEESTEDETEPMKDGFKYYIGSLLYRRIRKCQPKK